MGVELDHIFILCNRGPPQAALLSEAGLIEGPPDSQPGQALLPQF